MGSRWFSLLVVTSLLLLFLIGHRFPFDDRETRQSKFFGRKFLLADTQRDLTAKLVSAAAFARLPSDCIVAASLCIRNISKVACFPCDWTFRNTITKQQQECLQFGNGKSVCQLGIEVVARDCL